MLKIGFLTSVTSAMRRGTLRSPYLARGLEALIPTPGQRYPAEIHTCSSAQLSVSVMIQSSFSVLESVTAKMYPPSSSLSSVVTIWMCPPCAAAGPLPVTTLLLESALLLTVIASAVKLVHCTSPLLVPFVLALVLAFTLVSVLAALASPCQRIHFHGIRIRVGLGRCLVGPRPQKTSVVDCADLQVLHRCGHQLLVGLTILHLEKGPQVLGSILQKDRLLDPCVERLS